MADQRRDVVAERNHLARLLLVATMLLWCALPVLLHPYEATDVTPYVVAGDLTLDDQTEDLYINEDGEVTPDFAEVSCGYIEGDCLPFPFVSPPPSVPVGVGLSMFSLEAASMLMRVLSALAFVVTMALLWRRLRDTSSYAPVFLALTAVLMTPVVEVTLAVGNNAPLMVLLAALPLARRNANQRWDVLIGVGVGLSTALKVFPVVLIAVALAWRRLRIVTGAVVTLGVLVVLAQVLTPLDLYQEFLRSSATWGHELLTAPSNGSINAGAEALSSTFAPILLWGFRLAVVGLVVRLHRRVDIDHLWVLALPLTMLFFPQVWTYYLWFPVIAVAALAPLTGRVWLVPIVAATTIPAALTQHLAENQPLIFAGAVIAGCTGIWAALPASLERAPVDAVAAKVPQPA